MLGKQKPQGDIAKMPIRAFDNWEEDQHQQTDAGQNYLVFQNECLCLPTAAFYVNVVPGDSSRLYQLRGRNPLNAIDRE